MERSDAGIDVALFSEVSVSVMSGKHHGDPVVSCVMHWLFIASATYIIHSFRSPVAPLEGRQNACRVRQKKEII
jgi:hypothetical protein